MNLKIRINKLVRNAIKRLFPIPEDNSDFYCYCECCQAPLYCSDETKMDDEGVVLCKECYDGWIESEKVKDNL